MGVAVGVSVGSLVVVGDDDGVADDVLVLVRLGVAVSVGTTCSVAVGDAVADRVAVPVAVAEGGGVLLGVGVTDGGRVGKRVSVTNWPGVDCSVAVAVPGTELTAGVDEGVNVDAIPPMVASDVTVTIGGGSVGIGPGAKV